MRLLIIDDERALRENVASYFAIKGHDVAQAADAEAGLSWLREQSADVVLLDLRLPDRSGLEVLEIIKREWPSTGVVMITGYGDVEIAVQALQLRADQFLLKPMKLEALSAIVERVASLYARQTTLEYLQSRLKGPDGLSRRFVLPDALLRQVQVLADSPSTTVLLQGETGTGKGLVASLIHELSARRDRPFVDLNCAGLGGSLLDSDLFGYERGAFTDAKSTKRGMLEVAGGGTLFLDEIGEMPLDVQAKLLKVLEDKRFRRLGGTSTIGVDIRLISASNKDLSKAVQAGKFRQDLYYRLSVMPMVLPPLRGRFEDICALADLFAIELGRSMGKPHVRVGAEAYSMLRSHGWPGNVRELRNVVEHSLLLCQGKEILPAHLPETLRGSTKAYALRETDDLRLETIEARHIEKVLQLCSGNRSRTAMALGIHRVTLLAKMKRYGLV
jgi:DNA-binding NtrC family response regulator